MFINIHTHRKNKSQHEIAIRNAYHFKVPKPNNYFVSSGIHPWHISKIDIQSAFENVCQMTMNDYVLAVGECGLDRAIACDFDLQLKIFEQHLLLAIDIQKPVIIHCVRAYELLIPFSRKYNIPFIIHGFKGNTQEINQLLKQKNIYFSFGKRLLTQFNDQIQLIKTCGANRMFLESDVSNHHIEEIYSKTAQGLRISSIELESNIMHTFAKIFPGFKP